MEFAYVKSESSRGPVYRPSLPVTLSYGKRTFPIGHALVDTGADMTILPIGIAHLLEIELDDSKSVQISGAGGGSFVATPSHKKIGYSIEKHGFQPIRWKGIAYFATESAMLLGHEDCLEKFDLTFCGPERMLQVLPRF